MSTVDRMLAALQLNRYSPMMDQNGRLLNVVFSAFHMDIGSGCSAESLSRVTRNTTSGGMMDTSPSPMPRTTNRIRLSVTYQPSTVARMMVPIVPVMENTM